MKIRNFSVSKNYSKNAWNFSTIIQIGIIIITSDIQLFFPGIRIDGNIAIKGSCGPDN